MRPSVLFSLFAVVISAAAQTGLKHEGNDWTRTEQGSFTVDPKGEIRIKLAGNIRLRGGSGSQVDYKLTRAVRSRGEYEAAALLDRFPLTKAQQGRTAVFQVAFGPFATNLEISIPRGMGSVAIDTVGGDIDVSELAGMLVAHASGGRINVGHVDGAIDIRSAGGSILLGSVGGSARCLSGGGEISAGDIHGDAILETGGGDIVLRKAGGSVRASTGGGRVEVIEAKGMVEANTSGGPIVIGSAGGVRGESSSGSIVAKFLPGIALLDSFLTTGAGDITVWIPSNVKMSVKAQNEGSASRQSVVSEFPGLRVLDAGSSVVAELLINGGGPVLQLSGMGGRIYIRKR